jgi:hypothetical protein
MESDVPPGGCDRSSEVCERLGGCAVEVLKIELIRFRVPGTQPSRIQCSGVRGFGPLGAEVRFKMRRLEPFAGCDASFEFV